MALYVADTHSLLWYFFDAPRLGLATQQAFDEVDAGRSTLIVPTIVLAEMIYVAQAGRLQFDLDMVFESLVNGDNYAIAPFDLTIAQSLRWATAIPEMHDRMIACTALHYGARLITKDPLIQASGLVETIW